VSLADIENMMTETNRLTAEDRAELCRRLDLPALMAADGLEVRRDGGHLKAKLRPGERTASCCLYPPGAGRFGAKGWTFKDYGGDAAGDALGYLIDFRGLDYADAVNFAIETTRHRPKGWSGCARERLSGPGRPERPKGCLMPAPTPEARSAGHFAPCMSPEDQRTAALALMWAIEETYPGAAAAGEDALRARGCLPADGLAVWMLPTDTRALAELLAAGSDADLLARAGLLKPADGNKPARLAWWDETLLLGCHDAEGVLAYFVGRRMNWKPGDRFGKYINQSTQGGAVRLPFNLPALLVASGRMPAHAWKPAKKDLLIVEGPTDALGAGCLGWPAVAMLNRPGAYSYADTDGAAARMLTPNLPALRDVSRVLVVPDNDPGDKGAEGMAQAYKLAAWLRGNGCRADVALLADLCPDAAAGCKDLADVAKGSFFAVLPDIKHEQRPAP